MMGSYSNHNGGLLPSSGNIHCFGIRALYCYFMRYDTFDIHETIFDMYQQYILSGFRPK